MNADERHLAIEKRLHMAFSPTHLTIRDDSHHHRGHPGSASGMGHYHLEIQAEGLNKHPRITQHRLIYQALGDLMQTEIHAVSIHIIPNA